MRGSRRREDCVGSAIKPSEPGDKPNWAEYSASRGRLRLFDTGGNLPAHSLSGRHRQRGGNPNGWLQRFRMRSCTLLPALHQALVCPFPGAPGELGFSCVGSGKITEPRRKRSSHPLRHPRPGLPCPFGLAGRFPNCYDFAVAPARPGRTGFGTDVINRMVPVCEKLGLRGIEGVLVGDGHDPTEQSASYYVWPSLGFDALLSA